MDAPRAPHHEMVDVGKNRSVLGTFSPELLRCAHYSLTRAVEFGNQAKVERILAFMGDTAGLDGRGREDLRDALMGARAGVAAIAGQAHAAGAQPAGKW